MGIKKVLKGVLAILIAMLFINAQCRKLKGCAETVYNFEIPIKAYPDKDSMHIGDTLWLEMHTPDTLRDINTSTLVDYSGVENLGAGISFQKLDTITQTFIIKALKKFDLVLIKGRQVSNNFDPEVLNEYIFDDTNGYYQFKLGIIPKEIGIYGFIVSNASNVYRQSDQCTKAAFIINFSETDRHYSLYPSFPGGQVPEGGDYYFKVVP